RVSANIGLDELQFFAYDAMGDVEIDRLPALRPPQGLEPFVVETKGAEDWMLDPTEEAAELARLESEAELHAPEEVRQRAPGAGARAPRRPASRTTRSAPSGPRARRARKGARKASTPPRPPPRARARRTARRSVGVVGVAAASATTRAHRPPSRTGRWL